MNIKSVSFKVLLRTTLWMKWTLSSNFILEFYFNIRATVKFKYHKSRFKLDCKLPIIFNISKYK